MSKYYNFLSEDPLLNLSKHPNLLGCDDLASSIASLLRNVPENSLVGLWGDWGSGKSRVLSIIHGLVSGDDIPAVTCEFNPWLNATKGNWISRARAEILAAAKHKVEIDKAELDRRVDEATKDFTAREQMNVVKKAFKVIFENLKIKTDGLEFLKEERIDFDELESLVWSTTIEYVREKQRDARFFVFIDDLDRCSADYIRALLDRIYGSLRKSNVTFLVVADRGAIIRSLQELLPGRDKLVATQYIEKLIAIDASMPIPSASQMNEFVQVHISDVLKEHDQSTYITALNDQRESLTKRMVNPDVWERLKGCPKGFSADETKLAIEVLKNVVDASAVKLIHQVATNPRRVKRVLVRYLRVIELWTDHCSSRFDGRDDLTAMIDVACVFEIAVSLISLRENSPVFYQTYLLYPSHARECLACLAEVSQVRETLREELAREGYFHNLNILQVAKHNKPVLHLWD